MVDGQRSTGLEVGEHHTSRRRRGAAIGVAAILVATCSLFVSPGAARAVQFHGTVVDAKTREPLAGAAVVVVWRKRPYLAMDGPIHLHKLREVVTDEQGHFSIDGSPGIDWNPLTHVQPPPQVVVYALGYQPLSPVFMVSRGYRRDEDLLEALERGAVIALPRLTTDVDRGNMANLGALFLATDVPLERIPNLLRLVNEQAQLLGLPPYPLHR